MPINITVNESDFIPHDGSNQPVDPRYHHDETILLVVEKDGYTYVSTAEFITTWYNVVKFIPLTNGTREIQFIVQKPNDPSDFPPRIVLPSIARDQPFTPLKTVAERYGHKDDVTTKVRRVGEDGIRFDNGWYLYSHHDQDCCEQHYLQFKDLTLEDFNGMKFDLTGDEFFERAEGFGIRLIPVVGTGRPVSIAGYADNNGYYSSDLTLHIEDSHGNVLKQYDIRECQNY